MELVSPFVSDPSRSSHPSPAGCRWADSPPTGLDPVAARLHANRPRSPQRSARGGLLIGLLLGAALLAGGAAAAWAFVFGRGVEPALPVAATAEPAIDPELQGLVDDWRSEDAAGAPSDWQLKQLQRLKDSRDGYVQRLEALRLEHAAAQRRAQSGQPGARQAAAWDANLAAEQARQLQAEIARYQRRIDAMEQQLGLASD